MRQRVFGHTGVGWGARAVDGVLVMNRGCRQVLTVSLVTWEGCGTWVVVRRLVSRGSGVSQGDKAGAGAVLVALAAWFVALELRSMV